MEPSFFSFLTPWRKAGGIAKPRWLGFGLVLGLGLLAAPVAWAQPGNGGPVGAGPTTIPLDGGASLLLASGIGYGLRRLRQKRAARKTT